VRVVVVGAGVVGLTCAVRLAEEGYEAHVLARDLPLETTSAVAAAIWYPYRAEPLDQVLAWSARSFAALADLADREPRSGVRMLPGTELLRSVPVAPVWWAPAVPGIEAVGPDALPPGYPAAHRLTVPVVDMTVHLPWLVQRLDAAGGTLTRASLTALPDAPLVVNATGLAGRRLAGDDSLVPVRGQVVHVEAPSVREWLLDCEVESELTYVVPRERVVVVGGTAEVGSWQRDPDQDTAAAILARATRLVPELAAGRVVAHRVGLRPARPAVRLEAERRGGSTVLHCYGHGGAGVTLAQACAEDVVALARAAAPARV
jgi:D-amino-acid oxidase